MHWIVTGISGCGKSRAMREIIIPAHRRAGRWVVVLDPLAGTWPANWTTTDPHAFDTPKPKENASNEKPRQYD